MIESLRSFFTGGVFNAHGHCYFWTKSLMCLHTISDALIGLAYFSIPITLAWFVRRRRDIDFGWMFQLFAVFILACGMTHLMEIWNIWYSAYWLSGSLKAITALASVPTAILLTRLIPQALQLPSPKQLQTANHALEEEIKTRRVAEESLRELNAGLEERVARRTVDLEKANEELRPQRDGTQSREEANARLAAIVESSSDAIISKGLDGTILSWNAGAEKTLVTPRKKPWAAPSRCFFPQTGRKRSRRSYHSSTGAKPWDISKRSAFAKTAHVSTCP